MIFPNCKEGQLVEILWHDAGRCYPDDTWLSLDDVDYDALESDLTSMQTIGYFLHKTKDTIFLCQTYCSGRDVSGMFSIPIGCIRVFERK